MKYDLGMAVPTDVQRPSCQPEARPDRQPDPLLPSVHPVGNGAGPAAL